MWRRLKEKKSKGIYSLVVTYLLSYLSPNLIVSWPVEISLSPFDRERLKTPRGQSSYWRINGVKMLAIVLCGAQRNNHPVHPPNSKLSFPINILFC